MAKKYCVTLVRYGCLFVEANSEAEAMNIADRQVTDTISWSEDWSATDAEETDEDVEYITKPEY